MALGVELVGDERAGSSDSVLAECVAVLCYGVGCSVVGFMIELLWTFMF